MKDPFSIFIEDSVYYATNQYYKDMFRTKQLFFDCLKQKKSTEFFKEEASKIWGNIDHSYMKQRIEELEKMISATNSAGHKIINPDATFKETFKLEPDSRFTRVEYDYSKTISKYYDTRLETIKEGYVDEQTYMNELVKKYDDNQATIPYYNKDGTIRSYHNIAGYSSMLFNTNLNRSGWNRSMYDAELLGNDLAYLPAHPFACPLCIAWQGRVYSISGKNKKYPPKENAIDGGVGHPNCRHQWLLYWEDDQIQEDKYNSPEWGEKYQDKQKIRSLELERSRLKNDKSIYEKIGSQDEADKVNSRIKKINNKIKEINTKNVKTATNFTTKPKAPTKIINKGDIYKQLEDQNIIVNKESFKNFKEDVLNRQMEQLNNLSKKYPISTEDMPLRVKAENLGRGVGGQMGGSPLNKSRNLELSKSQFGNKTVKEIQEDINKQMASGWHVKVDGDKSDIYIITHEYGHYLQNYMLDQYNKANAKIFEEFKDKMHSTYDLTKSRRIFKAYLDKFNKDQFMELKDIYQQEFGSSIVNEISKYGKSNYAEAWAELFTDYELNNGSTNVGKAVKIFLERNLKL